jgi:hypothetical protein
VVRRSCPAALVFAAFVLDLGGDHTLSLGVLLLAIPASFALLLDCYGRAVEGETGLLRTGAAGAGLVLVVSSAALRSPALVGGVPRIAVSALAVAVVMCAAATLPQWRPAAASAGAGAPREDERLADAA